MIKIKKSIFATFVISLGGFLFGFDAGIISRGFSNARSGFNIDNLQIVNFPSFAAMCSMLISGHLGDRFGRKKMLIYAAFLSALSAVLSLYAISDQMLYIARVIGGIAIGAILVLAPIYISEISLSKSRGRLVSVQYLNIVLGFLAAYLSNYYLDKLFADEPLLQAESNIYKWRCVIGAFFSILYFVLLFLIPESPRWLLIKNRQQEGREVFYSLYRFDKAQIEIYPILKNLKEKKRIKRQKSDKATLKQLWKPSLARIIGVGLVIGIFEQISGIELIYFYADTFFKEAELFMGALLVCISLLFAIFSILLIDRIGRRSLLLVGTAGMAISLLLCTIGFKNTSYRLSKADIAVFDSELQIKLNAVINKIYYNDVDFKDYMKQVMGIDSYKKNEYAILKAATKINQTLILIGILGFVSCYSFSFGPLIWVIVPELYPNEHRGLAMGLICFVNAFSSCLVQKIFPWALYYLGNEITFYVFGLLAIFGFFILYTIVPETKGKSLEQLEIDLQHHFSKH